MRVQTLTMLTADLDRYYSALDKALMQFHNTKIQQINDLIKQMWSDTYQGNDIDSIQIRSNIDLAEGDDEGGSAAAAAAAAKAASAKNSRSYNYRVVMAKGESELDMRGRCSAGQKVLASIVIRLALAESFTGNAGLLALDEPTTNLDEANKRGLARSLAKLIDSRSSGSPLQVRGRGGVRILLYCYFRPRVYNRVCMLYDHV